MIMDTGRLSVEILFIVLLSGSVFSVQKLYATEGSVFEILCPLTGDVMYISWTGPPNSTIYAVGNEFVPEIPFISIKQCSSCFNSVLVIRNMTKDKEGQYECYKDNNAKSDFAVSLKRNPSVLRIINETTDNQVIGVEGHVMILICTVKRGQPEGNITWTENGNVLAVNLSEHVYLSLTPKRSDNGRTVQCTAYNSDGEAVENREIKLLIYYRPNVTILSTPSKIIQEGQILTMECLHGGNDPNTRTQWIRNETKIIGNESTIFIRNVSRMDAGNYTCCVSSRAVTDEETVTIEVYYSPAVIVTNQQTGKTSYLLTCVANGIPSNNVFYQWEHMTDIMEHIRFVNGSSNGELTISYENHDGYYQNSGIYLCNVSNNVPNFNGSIYQTGTTSLNIQGRPLFLTSNKPVHYGIYGREGKIKLFVYSYPKYETITVSCKNITLRKKSGDGIDRYDLTETEVTVQDMIFGSVVKVQAYIINIEIERLQEYDFTNLTILAENSKGSAKFTLQLKSAHAPEPPLNVSAKAHMNSILVYWDRGFDGGYPQTFVLEYKENEVPLSTEWNIYDEIKDTISETYSVTIDRLKFDRLYVLRLYSYNIVNRSQIIYTDHIRTQYIEANLQMMPNPVLSFVFILSGILIGFLVCCVIQGVKKKICFRMNQIRDTQHNELAETDAASHYDEIDIVYFGPLEEGDNVVTLPSSDLRVSIEHRNASFFQNIQNGNSERLLSIESDPLKMSNSTRDSHLSDESYLVPTRTFISRYVQTSPESSEGSSVSSNDNEANLEHVQEYESLQLVHIDEHPYLECHRMEEQVYQNDVQ